MQVKILRLEEDNRAEVDTEFGRVISSLGGDFKVGDTLDVELDLDNDFIWGENIALSDKNESKVYFKQGSTTIVAQVDAINPDDTAVLRLGNTCFLIDVENCPADLEGKFVLLIANVVLMHPTNI